MPRESNERAAGMFGRVIVFLGLRLIEEFISVAEEILAANACQKIGEYLRLSDGEKGRIMGRNHPGIDRS